VIVLLIGRADVERGLHHVRLGNEENEGIKHEWWHWLVRIVVGFHEFRGRMGGKKLGVIVPAF
jgi:hypothetical protein